MLLKSLYMTTPTGRCTSLISILHRKSRLVYVYLGHVLARYQWKLYIVFGTLTIVLITISLPTFLMLDLSLSRLQ